eukprot:CAMPEP_0170576242 /NCGR_PEP_ID=MMETSP0224-20130122/4287_1 /TAXON_ID=285029 /ORGANISM="Togula jolla, Strain CCCM 725" /LENGTH=82 /DNA_ID=CAMNT_0010899069 /DNA_START=202 /DNA_END=450 /DNA_ORIENTATION=+
MACKVSMQHEKQEEPHSDRRRSKTSEQCSRALSDGQATTMHGQRMEEGTQADAAAQYQPGQEHQQEHDPQAVVPRPDARVQP